MLFLSSGAAAARLTLPAAWTKSNYYYPRSHHARGAGRARRLDEVPLLHDSCPIEHIILYAIGHGYSTRGGPPGGVYGGEGGAAGRRGRPAAGRPLWWEYC